MGIKVEKGKANPLGKKSLNKQLAPYGRSTTDYKGRPSTIVVDRKTGKVSSYKKQDDMEGRNIKYDLVTKEVSKYSPKKLKQLADTGDKVALTNYRKSNPGSMSKKDMEEWMKINRLAAKAALKKLEAKAKKSRAKKSTT